MVLTIHQKSTQTSQLFIFVICLLFRYLNAYLTRTYDNPDEYWQGQEVAHHLVFGYGYLTWEWQEKIRSFAHPLTVATIYKCLKSLGLEHSYILIAAPRYFQATLAAVADLSTYTLAKKVFGNHIALPMLFTTLCSWFNFLMAARTLSNSMEMVFTMVALNFWPIPGVVDLSNPSWLKDYRIALVLALTACIMRPTNALIWLFLGIQLIFNARHYRLKVILNAAILCFIVILADALIDTRLYTSKWSLTHLIFTPYLFFKINVVNSISLFYGVHTWHWYITQGLPVILTTFLPVFLYGFYTAYHTTLIFHRIKSLLYLTIWIISIYSLLPHKEFRFIFPIVPILHMLSAYGLLQLTTGSKKRSKQLMIFLLSTQLPLSLYLSLWHQRGVMDVMHYLRDQPTESISFLMPCHSTPYYSILHKKTPMWFLTCEPPLDPTTLDESDAFYQDPLSFLQDLKNRTWPTSHLVLFDNLNPILAPYLTELGYTESKRFFNSHFHDDPRRRGDVIVMSLSP